MKTQKKKFIIFFIWAGLGTISGPLFFLGRARPCLAQHALPSQAALARSAWAAALAWARPAARPVALAWAGPAAGPVALAWAGPAAGPMALA